MRKVSGTLNGTGAAIYLGLGFIPDEVEMFNLESSAPYILKWNKNMRSAEQIGGYVIADSTVARLTETAGVEPYVGGDVVASGNTAYLIPTAEVLGQGDLSKKGETISTKVSTWTLDTSGNRTGSFDAGVNTSYVGEGSIVRIWDPIKREMHQSTIMVLTNDGDADDEVELTTAVPSGEVRYIGPMYDYMAAPAGVVMPAGIKVATTGNLNSSGESVCISAEQYLK